MRNVQFCRTANLKEAEERLSGSDIESSEIHLRSSAIPDIQPPSQLSGTSELQLVRASSQSLRRHPSSISTPRPHLQRFTIDARRFGVECMASEPPPIIGTSPRRRHPDRRSGGGGQLTCDGSAAVVTGMPFRDSADRQSDDRYRTTRRPEVELLTAFAGDRPSSKTAPTPTETASAAAAATADAAAAKAVRADRAIVIDRTLVAVLLVLLCQPVSPRGQFYLRFSEATTKK